MSRSNLLADLLAADPVEIPAIRKLLDDTDHRGRLHEVRSLPRKLQATLYDVCKDARAVTLEDLMPTGTPAGAIVRHHGINSMPMFRLFEKPMYRTEAGAIGGRNKQFWAWITGPGYFTITSGDGPGEENGVYFDYTTLPDSKPPHWPAVRNNTFMLSYFVYAYMHDFMRSVSEHVTIGKAYKKGKGVGAYFILVREDPERAIATDEPKALPAPGGG